MDNHIYNLGEAEVCVRLNTSINGLNGNQIEQYRKKGLKNELARAKKVPLPVLFLLQLKNVMTVILLVSAVISGVFAHFVDMCIIIFVVLLNAVLGVTQEAKAEKAVEALKKLTADKCKVRRGGEVEVIAAAELLPGDIVLLEAGDIVPADMRLIEAAGIQIDESSLTGESMPAAKTAAALAGGNIALGDRKNMAHMGSFVSFGRGTGVVTAIGMDTEMGRIAGILNETKKESTPLTKELNGMGRIISVAVLAICMAVFILNIVHSGFGRDNLVQYFLLSVSLAVAAIPEGLSTVVTLLMAMGITRMSKKNAIVRKLPSIETLGCTEVICSDKTGTLTQNKMTVAGEFVFSSRERQRLLSAATLCNDCFESGSNVTGDPTEAALLNWAHKSGIKKAELEAKNRRVYEIPFTSQRKLMTTFHMTPSENAVAYCKGAPDVLLEKCGFVERDGRTEPMTTDTRRRIEEENSAMAGRAYRVIGLAYRPVTGARDYAACERELIFIGLIGMTDPVRPEAAAAIERCRAAGIKPIMITGDHIETAVAIGKELKLIGSAKEAMTGRELDGLSDKEFESVIHKYGVYARVSPENKVRIVKTWKKLGKVCAMTGDGVNDAPALKTSDIGIGMGIAGTDVTKKVADIVLADDNFATIVIAVEEGRKIYDNIKKTVQFLLSTNLAEVFTLLVASIFGLRMISAVQILWVNLVTDTVPAVGLGLEPSESNIMSKPPRKKGASIFSGDIGFNILWQSLIMTFFVCAAYTIGARTSAVTGMTMAFMTLSLTQIAHSFNLKQFKKSVFRKDTLSNKTLLSGCVITLALTVAIIYIPGVNAAFNTEPLSVLNLLYTLLLSFAIIPVVEVTKLPGRKR